MTTPAAPALSTDELARRLGVSTELALAIIPVVLENLRTLDRKQQDYGSLNLTKFGTFGVVVRMNDKMERIINLLSKVEAQKERGKLILAAAANEPLADSFLDLANYTLIAYVMSKGLWPKVSAPWTMKDLVAEMKFGGDAPVQTC